MLEVNGRNGGRKTIRDAAQISLFKAIRAILLDQWDPIGITETGGPPGEYDSYVWPIVAMVQRAATPENIAAHLLQVERSSIGLPGDEARSLAVARLLAVLPQSR
ncbi:MAG: hypothetical protein JWR51_4001 [Devosia sp.]|uniref:hypothetical protein n=1 Tax=Devosia sp. TaxID=1871048 RepID=UPI002624B5A0|nr:hypothetical protein [Devosia sp.]MDB5530898.1 hypothetical protein [Devosia sp.]